MSIQHGHLPFSILMNFAWRNLWRHRRRTLITLTTIGIGFGLAVLFIGIGDGSHNSMVRNAIKLGEGHLTIQPKGYQEAPANYKYIHNGKVLYQQLISLSLDANIAPRISLQVLASTASNSTGAMLEGMQFQLDTRTSMLKPFLIKGRWLTEDDHRGILIGQGMAQKLKAKVGSKVVIMAGKKDGDSQAQLARVRGIFNAHINEMDDFLIISNLSLPTEFLVGEGANPLLMPVTRLALFLNNPDDLSRAEVTIEKTLIDQNSVVLNWQEMMPQLVQFIILDDAGNYVFLVLILIMVIFGIVNTVLMSVLERTREFGLLRALGISRRQLLLLVFCEAVLLSFLSVTIGWLVGGSTHLWFAHHGIDFSALMAEGTSAMGTFMDPVIYTELSWDRVLQLTIIVFAATLSTGVYPAIKAARVAPVEALRT
ncbi:MAG: hypothetical protein DSZ27_06300 [Thiomicrospira sp.]|nr:MAG: hypothetical protein DSZ27_06300 [Thiomicrospira sp.]